MSGNTIGHLFRVTSFGESHGPAIGCVVDGCPPGLALARGGHPARARPAPAGHVAPRHAAARAGHGRDPVRRVRGPHHRHADRAPDPQPGRAQQGLREHRRHVPARATPTTRTGRSTASATIAAAGASRRARPRCASPPARSRRSGCAERYGVAIRGHLTQLGPHAIPFEGWEHVDANPFFAANAAHRRGARAVHGRAAQVGRLLRRARHGDRAAACRSAGASRSTTSSTPTSPTA